jgi:hypothetical protein
MSFNAMMQSPSVLFSLLIGEGFVFSPLPVTKRALIGPLSLRERARVREVVVSSSS